MTETICFVAFLIVLYYLEDIDRFIQKNFFK